jgi:hypothetical protein
MDENADRSLHGEEVGDVIDGVAEAVVTAGLWLVHSRSKILEDSAARSRRGEGERPRNTYSNALRFL